MTQIHFEWGGDTLFGYITGEVDHHWAARLREKIDTEVLRKAPGRLVLDLGGVTFMDSSGVGLILGRYKLMETFGGRVVVQNPSTAVGRMLELSGIHSVVEIMNGGKV